MSTKTKSTAAGTKPSALKQGYGQSSGRAGGGVTSKTRQHSGASSRQPLTAPTQPSEGQLGVVPSLGRNQAIPVENNDDLRWATDLGDLTSVIDWIESEQTRENEQRARSRHRFPHYRKSLKRDDSLHLLDRTNFQALETKLPSALKGWLKRSKTQEQLRIPGFDAKVAIAASSLWDNAQAYVRCCPFCAPGRSLYPCDETHLCPICHNKNVGDPIQQKFGGSYGKAPYWYALTFSYTYESKKARLTFITRRDSEHKPIDPHRMAFPSEPMVARRLTRFDTGHLESCGRVPFKVLERMCSSRRLHVGGALGGLDLFVDFVPVGIDRVEHGLVVHVHVLVNSAQPLSPQDAERIYLLFCKQWLKAGIPLFPDLQIAKLRTQSDFKNWLRYVLKPMKFEEFYTRGAEACADRPRAFNDEFDQAVFSGAELSYGSVKTPRYYGNMRQRKNRKQDFIGVWQYSPTLNKKDFERIRALGQRNVSVEEWEKYEEHLRYLDQKAEQERGRKDYRRSRRRGGRTSSNNNFSDDNARAAAYARFREREGEP